MALHLSYAAVPAKVICYKSSLEETTLESLISQKCLTLYLELISLEETILESLILERYPTNWLRYNNKLTLIN